MMRAAKAFGAAAIWLAASSSGGAAEPEKDVAVWDGGPSFGGAWVAHREAGPRPLRVTVVTPEGDETAAVLIRAGAGAGAGFTVSADVARALGLDAGVPVELSLLRREAETVASPTSPEGTPAEETGPAAAAPSAPPASEPRRVRPGEGAPESVAVLRAPEAAASAPPAAGSERRISRPAGAGRDVAPRRAPLAAEPPEEAEDAAMASVEVRRPRARPSQAAAPAASPRPLGRPGPGAPS